MISHESLLRKLPAGLDRKQAMYIDGIRHAAEIAGLAYSRLRETLTQIAISDLAESEIVSFSTLAFLDAWAFVDAVDRFRTLWKQIPRSGTPKPIPGVPTLDEALKSIRDLRNIADHIAQRIDLIMSKHGAALGVVSWFTATSTDPVKGFFCAIIPGILTNPRTELPSLSGRAFEFPTGAICLEAGGYKANLCDVLPHLALRITALEEAIAVKQLELPVDEPYAGSGMIVKLEVQFEGWSIGKKTG